MKDPARDLLGYHNAFDEITRRQRLIDDTLKSSATSHMMEVIERASAKSSALEEVMRRQSVMDDALKSSATSRMMEVVEQASAKSRALEDLAHHSKLIEFTQTPAYLKVIEFTQTPAYLKAIELATAPARLADVSRAMELSQLVAPKLPEILKLSEIAAARVQPFDSILKAAEWSAVLADRMARVDVAWALDNELEGSAEAFGRLGRLSDVAREGRVYVDETTEILVEELGQPSEAPAEAETVEQREERYDDAGRDRELIAFPPASYNHILVSAGYAVSFPPPPTVTIEEGLIEPVRFSPQTGFLLQSLEAHLRVQVANRLHALEGEAWIRRRVPEKVREKWREGREGAKIAGKPVLAPIHYANFMDLADIITAGNNWPEFEGAFTSKDNFRVSLQRLYYIRNDVAHARPLSMTDELLAITEATILFRALGLPVRYDA